MSVDRDVTRGERAVHEAELRDLELRLKDLRYDVYGGRGPFTALSAFVLTLGVVSQVAGWGVAFVAAGAVGLWVSLVPALRRDREMASLNAERERLLEAIGATDGRRADP